MGVHTYMMSRDDRQAYTAVCLLVPVDTKYKPKATTLSCLNVLIDDVSDIS